MDHCFQILVSEMMFGKASIHFDGLNALTLWAVRTSSYSMHWVLNQ